MRKLGIWLVVLVVAAYGGLKAYIWYDLKRGADKLIQQAAPFAEIKYGGISTSLSGSMGFEDIVIRPTMTDDEFRIKTLGLESSNLYYFISGIMRLNEDQLPKDMAVVVRGLHLELDSELFRMMDKVQQQAAPQPSSGFQFEKLDALGCGELDSFGLSDYLRAGLREMNLDATARLQYDDVRRQLTAVMQVGDPKLFELDMNVRADVSTDSLKSLKQNTVPVSTITYRDLGWYQLRNEYCASLNQMTIEAYANKHMSLLREQLGVGLTAKADAAYRDMLLNGGTVTLTFNPAPNTTMTGLQYYAPADALEMLGLSISINEVVFDHSQIEWARAERAEGVAPAAEPADQQARANTQPPSFISRPAIPSVAPQAPVASVPPPVAAAPAYQAVVPDKLSGHVGRMVRVTTRDGRLREGRLSQVQRNHIEVALSGSSGGLTFTIAFADIRAVEVKL